ncbi:protein of unknown function [Micromonospora phaseoli]|uniref:DUF4419 domain-containing protein n=1 Tax=Micromonospora phaseoli TaxID=1144548 RepID=A0A1H7DXE5_9ACTN|nr:DUF4419 domain-containing protein [Micromonospora phaseoli]PZV88419.1 uncharacterized protein DUF4419 [Micromonospora phaseoli]GIJ81400.1 hypothetical protein Xph01_58320 [Micromonospora phaseoli]SEK06238.1 protein of unknown function [Micromonospora phaseoli]
MVTFRVDEVSPATVGLPTRPLGELFGDALVFGGDPALPVLVPDGVHPLLDAVGRAFAEHRPLVLSPDAVWLTIAQGVAQHIRLHAEELRPRLVSHRGRRRLTVTVDGPMPQDAASWQDVVESFHKLLGTEVSDAGVFECDFSTSTDVDRVAGRVVVLDAYSPYFSLWLVCVCGIPSVTVTGTVADWQKIRARVDAIAGFGLQKWCRSLAPIVDQFVRAAAGEVDVAFWRRIYNPVDAYGGEVVTGWAARLYPYLRGQGVLERPNPLLELPIDEPRNVTTDGRGFYHGAGIRTDQVPATLSRATVNVNDQVAGENRTVALHAGLVGVAQDDNGGLRPVTGWYLTPATVEIDDVVDRIVRDHETTPPQPLHLLAAPAEVVALYQRIGSATLFDTWRLLPVAEHRRIYRGYDEQSLLTIIDLADGRSICAALDEETQSAHWILCRVEVMTAARSDEFDARFRLINHPADVPVYGTSLAQLLDAALDSDGDISHLETGRLNQLDRPTR